MEALGAGQSYQVAGAEDLRRSPRRLALLRLWPPRLLPRLRPSLRPRLSLRLSASEVAAVGSLLLVAEYHLSFLPVESVAAEELSEERSCPLAVLVVWVHSRRL